jgi:serralysin
MVRVLHGLDREKFSLHDTRIGKLENLLNEGPSPENQSSEAREIVALTAMSPESGNEFVDAFINNGRHYVNAPNEDGTPNTAPFVINYYFDTLPGPTDPVTGRGTPYDWRPFEMQAWQKAVQGWSNVANVTFNQVFTAEEALFRERLEDQVTAGGTVSASHNLPSANPLSQSMGTYNFEAVNVRQWSPDQLESGGNFYRTFIHETGHGLGLKHPHDSGSGEFSNNYFPGITAEDTSAERQRSLGVLELNHMFGSVMSYIHGYEFDDQGHVQVVPTRQRPVADDFFLDHGFAGTPMAYDIAAIQYLYGANMAYRTEDNVYILPDSNDPHPFVRGEPNEAGVPESIIYQPDTAYWESIWDAGGIDEIRYDVTDAAGNAVAGSRNVIIDLTAATLDYSETGYGVLSYAAFIGGGYTIANGVVIENATGGDGNDQLHGNQAANVILGRGGDDVVTATGGLDTVDGGAGFDRLLFAGYGRGDVTVSLGLPEGRSGIGWSSADVTTFAGVELAELVDARVEYGASTEVALVDRFYNAVLGREGDALGLARWTALLEQGFSRTALADSFLSSAEGAAQFGGLDNAGFVQKVYGGALGRQADAAELEARVQSLTAGTTRAEILAEVAGSEEALAADTGGAANGLLVEKYNVLVAERTYQAAFGRSGEVAGLEFYDQSLRSGAVTEAQLSDIFVNSQEFTLLHGGQSNTEFVTSLYGNVFGRAGEQEGVTFWSGFLDNGGTRGQAVQAFLDADESQAILSQLAQNGMVLHDEPLIG